METFMNCKKIQRPHRNHGAGHIRCIVRITHTFSVAAMVTCNICHFGDDATADVNGNDDVFSKRKKSTNNTNNQKIPILFTVISCSVRLSDFYVGNYNCKHKN